MYPSIGAYKSLTMDDFIENFHTLIENYAETSETENNSQTSQIDADKEDQSQILNGINLNAPEGFYKTGDFEWSTENDLINIQSISEELSHEDLDISCKKGTRTTTFVNSDFVEISGKKYLICLQTGDNGFIIGQTVVYKGGYSYIITTATNPGEEDSFSRNEKAFERVGYLLGYMITRINYF